MWSVIPGQALRHRSWDDDVVVYNNLTGDTHLVSADAMAILQLLQQAARSAPALLAALQEGEADMGEALAQILADMLRELELLSLIEQTQC